MEDALVPLTNCFSGSDLTVLILVLMEDALVQRISRHYANWH